MATSEVSGRQLIRNTLANGLGSVVVALLAIALTPFFLNRLGPAEYGVWLLALTLTFGSGYLGLADLGLQQAGVRMVAAARSRDDAEEVNRVVSTMAVLFLVVGVVLAAVLATTAGALSSVFSVPADLDAAARTVFALVGLQIALDLPGASLLALIEGAQRYAMLRLIEVGTRVAWAVGAVVAVARGHGVVAMAVISLAAAAAGLVASFAVARRIDPRLRVSPRRASRKTLGEVVRQGSPLLALRILSVLYRQMDRAIIGVAIGTVAVARYEVAYKIHATAAIALSIAPSAVLPAAAYLGAEADREQMRALYLRGTKYAVALCVPVALAAIVYARALIVTWVGAEYEALTGVTRLFLVYPVLVSVHVIGVTMLVGLSRTRHVLAFSAVSVVVNLVLSVALTPSLGISGVVIGTLAGYALVWVPYLRVMLREFDVKPGQWVSAVLLPNLPPLVAQLTVSLLTVRLAERFDQLWQVALLTGASCAIAYTVFLFAVLRKDERTSLVRSVRRPLRPPVADTEP